MSYRFSRRAFIKGSAAVGVSAAAGSTLSHLAAANQERPVDPVSPAGLATMNGPDPFANTLAAIERVGGMGHFLPRGSHVAINANTAFRNRGSIVTPGALLATLVACSQAGAQKITLIKDVPKTFWKACSQASEYAELIDTTKVSTRRIRTVEIPGAIHIVRAEVDPVFLDADVYINLSLVKDHSGTLFTGALKNVMGATSSSTNQFCHKGPGGGDDWYADVARLSQSIADLNRLRRPDLCLIDATEFLTSNGPFGPGDLGRRDTVLACADPVAADSFAVRFLDLEASKVEMIAFAEKAGVGSADLSRLRIQEEKLS
ncbi:MAG: DUF362 domain-containing protein [bacterium]|nr:DUF362 domain-containing protein [bacterium]